jgi:hypothetical protein
VHGAAAFRGCWPAAPLRPPGALGADTITVAGGDPMSWSGPGSGPGAASHIVYAARSGACRGVATAAACVRFQQEEEGREAGPPEGSKTTRRYGARVVEGNCPAGHDDDSGLCDARLL